MHEGRFPSIEIRERLRRLGNSFLDLLHPVRCAGCAHVYLPPGAGYWCENCLKALPWICEPLCPRCGMPFPDSPSSGSHLCGDCILDYYTFDTARSATEFKGVVRDRIHQLKLGAQLHWISPLSELLSRVIPDEQAALLDIVLPVPLHVSRLRYRGFNQAAILAKSLARRLNVPVSFDLLTKRLPTRPQTTLNRQERLENVKNAFSVADATSLRGFRVLLIDDVFTTGSTINECSKALKRAGVEKVHALTVARAILG